MNPASETIDPADVLPAPQARRILRGRGELPPGPSVRPSRASGPAIRPEDVASISPAPAADHSIRHDEVLGLNDPHPTTGQPVWAHLADQESRAAAAAGPLYKEGQRAIYDKWQTAAQGPVTNPAYAEQVNENLSLPQRALEYGIAGAKSFEGGDGAAGAGDPGDDGPDQPAARRPGGSAARRRPRCCRVMKTLTAPLRTNPAGRDP